MVILPHSKNIGTTPLGQPKQRKEQRKAPPQVLPPSGLSSGLPSQVNPQGCPSTASGCPKSTWRWTWQRRNPPGPDSTGMLQHWSNPILDAAFSLLCEHQHLWMSCRAGSGAWAARSGRDGIQQLWQTPLRRGDPFICPGRGTQDLGIQGEAWTGAACVPWISGQSPWSGYLISVESQPSPYLLFHSRTVYLAFVLPHP